MIRSQTNGSTTRMGEPHPTAQTKLFAFFIFIYAERHSNIFHTPPSLHRRTSNTWLLIASQQTYTLSSSSFTFREGSAFAVHSWTIGFRLLRALKTDLNPSSAVDDSEETNYTLQSKFLFQDHWLVCRMASREVRAVVACEASVRGVGARKGERDWPWHNNIDLHARTQDAALLINFLGSQERGKYCY